MKNILRGLTPKAKWSIVRGHMTKLQKAGFTMSGALNKMKSMGLGVRKTDFMSEWRTLFKIKRRKPPLISMLKKYVAPESVITDTIDKQYHKYNHVYSVKIFDRLEKVFKSYFITVGADIKTILGVMDEAASIVAQSFKYGFNIKLISLIRESIKRSVKRND